MISLGGGLCPPSETSPQEGCAGEAGARKGDALMTAWRSAAHSEPPPVQGCAGEAGGSMYVGAPGAPDTPG
jgi:hypothetical protein